MTTDERRLRLKPAARRAWAPIGARPIALGRHRFQWLCATACVSPAAGECFRRIANGAAKPFLAALSATFAEETGAGRDGVIVLALANAGWRSESGLAAPEAIRLLFLPPDAAELQPAERRWRIVDEPIVNKPIPDLETLEAVISDRRPRLANDRQSLKGGAGFPWRPKTNNAS